MYICVHTMRVYLRTIHEYIIGSWVSGCLGDYLHVMPVRIVDTILLDITRTLGEFISLVHVSRWLGQSVGIPGRDNSFG
ncbi:hypothetical protein HanIR_Chr03g0116431 [Helianthus annuus]|nr:hypothetical protein HanIR_Chr03g0116431 [Helianthus annuus]